MRRIRDAVESIGNIPGARHPSRRASIQQPLLNAPEAAPPLYPGLPNSDQENGYEMMSFNPDTISQSLRSLARLSRSASRLTNQLQSRISSARSRRSASAPASSRSSKVSFFQPADEDDDDVFSTTSHLDFQDERSVGPASAPTPSVRTKTPSYMFLKATNASEV